MLNDKHIILTGAGGGLGRVIARTALAQGAHLALFERDTKRLEAAMRGLPPDNAHGFVADLTHETQIFEAVQAACKKLGRLDGLVNNAAFLADDDGTPLETSLASWQQSFAVNATGAFLMCKAVLPELLKGGHGSIVNMSSVVAGRGSAWPQIAYTSSKGALEAMTRELAVAYARDNIRANCVAPGPVLTDRTAHYFDTPEKWQARRRHIPQGRLGKAEEIAELVCFLLSDKATWTTGATYRVDGGISAAYLVDDRNGQPKAGTRQPKT